MVYYSMKNLLYLSFISKYGIIWYEVKIYRNLTVQAVIKCGKEAFTPWQYTYML